MDLQLFSVMPLLVDHADEICDDIERQLREKIATFPVFIMTLTPEGPPVIDKAAILSEKYRIISKKLKDRGLSCGILVQASIGHGYVMPTPIPFQPVIGMEDGLEKYVSCPYDPNFRSYIKDAMRTLASEHPSAIMVDDDFRLFARRSHHGCACPLHMAEVNRRAGTDLTREELVQKMEEPTEEGKRLVKIFYDTQVDSLIGAAKAMREGIDSVDPSIPGSFCACGDTCEGASEIARILAGEGNPIVLRVNNGRYCSPGPRGVVASVARAAVQIQALSDKVDVFLAETDTCPQNRYSTSAASLHTHFTLTLLEGARGCKHWITRTVEYEPKSGEAYRRKLSKNAAFYRELADVVKDTKWDGFCIPLPDHPVEPTAPLSSHVNIWDSAWAKCVFEVMGLPFFFSDFRCASGPILLDENRDSLFADNEIEKMLRGTVFMDSNVAKNLILRGFGHLLGVDVEEFSDGERKPTGERIHCTGTVCKNQMKPKKLIPSGAVDVHSTFYCLPDGKNRQFLTPGVTSFQNELGGTAVVFAGTPRANYNFTEAFSFLCEARKHQLIDLMEKFSDSAIYFSGDEEVYLKVGHKGDHVICALVNLGTDIIEEIPLTTRFSFTKIKKLMADGSYQEVEFTVKDGSCLVEGPLHTLDPCILIFE